MNIQIIGDSVDVTDKIKETIDTKISQRLDKLLTDFAPDMKTATMRLEQITHTQEYKVNFDMTLPGKTHIFAANTHKNLTTAITGLRDQIEKQVQHYRDDLIKH